MSYTKLYKPNVTPQSEPIFGENQVENNAGGYVFSIDIWSRLDRFLILGSDSATYYQSAKAMTKDNAHVVIECWGTDAQRTAQRIGDISSAGRAPKNDAAIFALALGACHEDEKARKASYGAVYSVCRTASHLFQWMDMCRQLGKGWGRGMKRVVVGWYARRSTDSLAYQVIKYRNRNNYNHKRALEISHRGAGGDVARQALYRWVRGKDVDEATLPSIVQAHLAAMRTEKAKDLVPLIPEHRLPWEAIPTWALRDPDVWDTMVPHLGLTALIRNLGNMTEIGSIKPMKTSHVVERLEDEAELRRSRVHPFAVLQALAVYKSGHGVRGSKSWSPVGQVIDALDAAFYAAFENVEPTGKRILLALDVSRSMGWPMMGSPLSCREASAALALVTMAREENVAVVGFTQELIPLNISPRQRLDDVVQTISGMPFGGTDCAQPMLYARQKNMEIDAFIIITDSETWAGSIHPVQALQQYRQHSGINAKCVVVGMTSTGFSIADPNDGGMLDVVGFDSSCPALIFDFIK